MKSIEQAIANRADDSFVSANDCITVGDIRQLIDQVKQLRFACDCFETSNRILGEKLLAGREDKLVRVPGTKPGTMKFFTKLGSEVPA